MLRQRMGAITRKIMQVIRAHERHASIYVIIIRIYGDFTSLSFKTFLNVTPGLVQSLSSVFGHVQRLPVDVRQPTMATLHKRRSLQLTDPAQQSPSKALWVSAWPLTWNACHKVAIQRAPGTSNYRGQFDNYRQFHGCYIKEPGPSYSYGNPGACINAALWVLCVRVRCTCTFRHSTSRSLRARSDVRWGGPCMELGD